MDNKPVSISKDALMKFLDEQYIIINKNLPDNDEDETSAEILDGEVVHDKGRWQGKYELYCDLLRFISELEKTPVQPVENVILQKLFRPDAFAAVKSDPFIFNVGDHVSVIFDDRETHYDGQITDICVEDQEIAVDGVIFNLSEVKEIVPELGVRHD